MNIADVPPRSLEAWLEYQLRTHPREIALGLDRVSEVWRRLGSPRPAPVVITVGGTNGKGSTVAFLEAMLLANGLRVGVFTSPHLLRYNERVRLNGSDMDDPAFIGAFELIERARGEIALTYFEFGTLAALLIFSNSALDVAVLEVGLGGRLDAVNIVDADAAIVTTIDLDHQDWLGSDLDGIGREKAGIFRAGRPAIVGEYSPPAGLIEAAKEIGADLLCAGTDYNFQVESHGWRWQSGETHLHLPVPALDAPCQHANAAAAIAALHALRERIDWNPVAVSNGVATATVRARLQRFAGAPEVIVDVAHNPQAARILAEWIGTHPAQGRDIAIIGALADKDIAGIVAPLASAFDLWFLGGLDGATTRGLSASALRERLLEAGSLHVARECLDVAAAFSAALSQAQPHDRIIAFGSFFVASAAIEFVEMNRKHQSEPAAPLGRV
jgi:dihydrofolate synthase/folylpolyglutamate synthase